VAGVGLEPTTKGLEVSSKPRESYNNGVSNIKSLLSQITNLSPEEKQLLFSLAHGKVSTLKSPGEGLKDWEADMIERGLAETSIHMYTTTVKKFLDTYPMPTSRDLRFYLIWRREHRYDGKPGGISDIKLRNDTKALRSFFGFLESENLWVTNPARNLRLTKTARRIREAPKPEHVQALLGAWNSERRIKDRALLRLIVDTGLRISEACSLRKDNIDFQALEIKVFGKGSRERLVPISRATATAIQAYLAKERPSGAYVFPSGKKPKHIQERYGEELQRPYLGIRTIERSFRRLCARLNIPKVTPHQLRHHWCTTALKRGMRVEIASRILGHSSTAVTLDTYRHVLSPELKAEHAKYSPLAGQES
jgi:integrase/recombinase XerD